MYQVAFDNKENAFFNSLRKRVNDYFSSNKLKSTGNYKLYIKAGILLSSALAFYVVLVFFTPPPWLSILICALLGLNLAAIGFNVMHDAAHGSFSSKQWVNDLMSYTLNIIGGN